MDSKNISRYFSIAGVRVCVCAEACELFEDAGILAPFEVEPGAVDHVITCRLVDSLPAPEGELVFRDSGRKVYRNGDAFVSYIGSETAHYIRVERQGTNHAADVLRGTYRDRISEKILLTALEVESVIAQQGAILLHTAWIAHKGEAILFTAPSGTGKSTQAELWCRYRGAEVINGDRAMVRCTETSAEAVGIPFCGSSGISKNRTLPIRAVVYLTQAPQNTVTRLQGVKAFRNIWEGCSVHIWNREDVAKATDAVQRLIAAVPVYHLACTPDEAAVSALEAVLYK